MNSEFYWGHFMKYILLVIVIIYVIAFDYKNENTYKNVTKISKAIYDYRVDCILNKRQKLVDYKDMEDYDKTFWRFWNWGYTRILSKDKFEIIKPYIK